MDTECWKLLLKVFGLKELIIIQKLQLIKFVSFETEKRQQQSFGIAAKFETQRLFVFYFPEILLVMLN